MPLAWLGESDLKLLLTGNHDSRTAETMFYTSHTFALQGLSKLCPMPPIRYICFYTMPRFCWKPLTHYHFNISYFPNIRSVLRQNTNLPVIRRHQSRNQGLGTPWSIGHAQNIRSLGRSWVKQNQTYFKCICILVQ